MRMGYLILAPLSMAMAAPARDTTIEGKTKIVFIAGKPSHGSGAHDHPQGCILLANCLNENMPGINAVVCAQGWPRDEKILEDASAIVVYCDGGGGHIVLPHLDFLDGLAKKGVGIVMLHYAVEVPKGEPGDKFLSWIGGYFEQHWSVNPHWTAQFKSFPDRPITRGVKPFAMLDEWYYHMRFVEGMKGVTPFLSALPPAATLKREDGPHSNNPHVREAVLERKEPQHVGWACERPDGGRGVGFTGGHFHKGWAQDDCRKAVLNAICWAAKVEIPENGVESQVPDLE